MGQGDVHPLRALHGRLPRAGHRARRPPQAPRHRAVGDQGHPGSRVHRVPRHRPAHRSRLRLRGLRYVQHGLPQQRDPAGAQRGRRQAALPHQQRRRPAPPRRPAQRAGELPRPDQVHPHLHADGPRTGRGPSRVRDADAPGPHPAPRGGPEVQPRKRVDPAREGDLPPRHRQHVLRSPVAHHVGGAPDGGGLPQRGAGHARADVHRRGRLPAPAAAVALPQVRHPPDRQRLLRLGRDHPRPARNEGRSLRRGDQVRPGSQARRRRPADVVQGQQPHRQAFAACLPA